MCWYGHWKNEHIAKDDIRVFKILYREPKNGPWISPKYLITYTPPFFYAHYEIGKEKSETIIPREGGNYSSFQLSIGKGIHCYSRDNCKWKYEAPNITVYYGTDRLASYRNLKGCYDIPNLKTVAVMQCVIPAGTRYWENDKGEIVTEKIIPERELWHKI